VRELVGGKGKAIFGLSGGYLACEAPEGANGTIALGRPDLSDIDLPAVHSVGALPLKCLMLERRVLLDLGGDPVFHDLPFSLELGLKLIGAGYINICTTMVTATDTSPPNGEMGLCLLPNSDTVNALVSEMSVLRRFRQ
jgi:hypothetical protein